MTQIQPILTQLHLGLGSFHRAHQAVYLQDLHEQGDTSWQIAGGNIRPDMLELIADLKASGGAYMLETVTPGGERAYQRIESIKQIIDFDAELSGLTAVAADPATRIISFTVTEAGYYLDSENNLDESYADLRTDLAGGHGTLYGALSVLLTARMAAEAGPVTLMNCDNLRSNGERFYAGFQQFLERRGETELLEWVRENTRAPNAMVDRITPRPTPDISERVLAATGVDDTAALMGEAFTQWVIEDDFIAGRPAWEKVGVEMVEDVMPYEEAKIRLLNATHSCLAWAGTLRGYPYIHEDCADPEILQLAYDYVTNDTIPCLDTPKEPCPLDLAKYRDVVLERFGNPNIQDTNQRVAMDGYSKLPGFILPTIRDSLNDGRSIDSVSMLPALFLVFLERLPQGKIPFEYQDQAMPEGSAAAICSADDVVKAFVDERLLFDDLAGDQRVLAAMRSAYERVGVFAG
uniref:D-arabinitol 4-dehydrogenase (EC) n=1 Tax=uncultured Thiotrichaceae bacterium TaxID=298394 RepID=A0A6S6UEK8_9GAMM|nr:MAG: D-arabinitol 4-dehydrogenase (EC [uncultured Thiotrichaceae bacterium]